MHNCICSEPARHDFSPVVAALKNYTCATGREALKISGWEVEDAHIGPPEPLVSRLSAIPSRLRSYAYARDLHTVKQRAAALFARGMALGGEPITPAHIAVAQNSTQALLLLLTALKQHGVERAVVASPAYFAAVEACAHLGLPVTFVPTTDFFTGALDVDRIAAAAGARTVVLLTNPAYSLGVEYTPFQLDELFRALPAGCWVALDETRLGLSWCYDAPWYAAAFPENALIVRSPSKVFFVNGLKMSVLLAPPSIVRDVDRLSEALLGSLPGNTEDIALAYLDAWRAWRDEAATARIGPMLRWKRGVASRLSANLRNAAELLRPAGFALSPVDSGPYVLAGAPYAAYPALDSRELALGYGVLLMDSSYFFHESDDWAAFRINLCGNPALTRSALSIVLRKTRAVAPTR